MKQARQALISSMLLCLFSLMTISAQENLQKSLISNGGNKISDGERNIYLSIGQPVVGDVKYDQSTAHIGFWGPLYNTKTTVLEAKNRSTDDQLTFSQNYPNPFSESTFFDLELPSNAHVSMRIYDIKGVLVHESLDEVMNHGKYTIEWQAKDVPAGVYKCWLTTGNQSIEQTLIKVGK